MRTIMKCKCLTIQCSLDCVRESAKLILDTLKDGSVAIITIDKNKTYGFCFDMDGNRSVGDVIEGMYVEGYSPTVVEILTRETSQ